MSWHCVSKGCLNWSLRAIENSNCPLKKWLSSTKGPTIFNTDLTEKSLVFSGLEITAGQRTMSGLIGGLTGQMFALPVMLTCHIRSSWNELKFLCCICPNFFGYKLHRFLFLFLFSWKPVFLSKIIANSGCVLYTNIFRQQILKISIFTKIRPITKEKHCWSLTFLQHQHST